MLQKTCMRNHATTARRARVTLKGIVAASQSPRQNRSSCATRAIHRDGAMVPASRRVARQVKASPPKAVAEGASGERTASANTGSRYVVVTGASSGLGLRCAADLARNGDHHVVMACRDLRAEMVNDVAVENRVMMPLEALAVKVAAYVTVPDVRAVATALARAAPVL